MKVILSRRKTIPRNGSELTQNFDFHGHYIFTALVNDLIRNTWITQAEQVLTVIKSKSQVNGYVRLY